MLRKSRCIWKEAEPKLVQDAFKTAWRYELINCSRESQEESPSTLFVACLQKARLDRALLNHWKAETIPLYQRQENEYSCKKIQEIAEDGGALESTQKWSLESSLSQ